jgi:L-lactate dehydrogenase complex protein LldE
MRVSLFITCLADQFLPEVGQAVVAVLRRLGVQVDFPLGQTCCGQLAFNLGYRQEARDVASRFLELFRDSEYVVAPSGSCIGMLRHHYLELFADDPTRRSDAKALAQRSYEFSEFLIKVLQVEDVGASFPHKVTYHDSCHLLRGLGIQEEPRRLIRAVRGIRFEEMNGANVCCGFGGAFSIKFPQISTAMMDEKLRNVSGSEAEYLIASDNGCLMHIRGGASRNHLPWRALHLAELLAKQEKGESPFY